jgi:hypothetical protein
MEDSFITVISSNNDETVWFGMPPSLNVTHHHSNSTALNNNDADATTQIVAWGWFAVMLMCFLIRSNTPDPTMRLAYIRSQERQRQEADPAIRKRVIQQSLITKRVIDFDKDGNLTLGDAVDTNEKLAVEDEQDATFLDEAEVSSSCVICLEPFRVGDDVTWSKEGTHCLHVFHHDCILQWLENPKHNDCPSCRYQILQFDDNNDENVDCESCYNEEEIHTSPLAFVIINGLISRARQASCSLIGNTIDAGDSVSLTPVPLRRVVSEGQLRPSLSNALYRSQDLGRNAWNERHDKVAADLESSLQLPRSVSEGSVQCGSSRARPSLFSGGYNAIRRVSSGIYSRLSSKGDDVDQLKSHHHDDDEEHCMFF